MASAAEALQALARGCALDLLDALWEVPRIDTVTVVASVRDGMPSVHCSAISDGLRVWKLSLVGDETEEAERGWGTARP